MPSDADVDVSVIIVNWNTRNMLLEVIQSLRETTNRVSLEIIVVDNASEDGSQEAVREHYPEVVLICNPSNLGFAKANNIGFAAARGYAVCLVNTDVIALNGVIDKLWHYLIEHPSAGMVGPRTYDENMRIRQNCRRFPTLANAVGDSLWLSRTRIVPGRSLPLSTYDHTHAAEVLSGCFLMVRREALEDVGPLDEDFFFYGEDTDWGKRFNDAGWGCVFHPAAEAIHLGGGSTKAYPTRYYLTMEKSDLLYWRKHHPPAKRGLYVGIRMLHHCVSAAAWAMIWLVRPQQRETASLKVRGKLINSVWLLTRRSLVETPGWS